MTFPMLDGLLHAALPLLLAAATDAAPAAAPPTVSLEADTVHADGNGSWSTAFTFHNPGQYALHGDSMFVDVTDLDPGVSRAPRHVTLPFTTFIQRAATVAAGEESRVQFSLPASCERGTLALRIYGQDGAGAPFVFRKELRAEPGELTLGMPSTFIPAKDVKGSRIEIVIATAAAAATGSKLRGVLLVPAETAHARSLARTAARLAAKGMNVVVVSPPGYGQSTGPADMSGPATLAALEAALAKLVALPGTDRTRLAVWGTGRGATAAVLLAAHHPEIKQVVAQDALYDLWASWRAADAATAANLAAEAGADSAAWKARSPLVLRSAPAARLLVIQGAGPDGPDRAARAYVAARLAAGAAVDTLYASPASRRLPKEPFRATSDFLAPPARN